jgi:hypothetical protein
VTAIYVTAAGARAVEQRYREVLRLWPVPSEWLFIPTREGNTFVVACGPPDAPPLLLLHGSAANSAMWIGDVASWVQDFRVYAVDGTRRRLEQTVPHATVRLLPDAGHVLLGQSSVVLDFLK